jgi:hypothetical protein
MADKHLNALLWLQPYAVTCADASTSPLCLQIQVETECGWRKIPKPPYFNRWGDLKKLLPRKMLVGNLHSCVEAAGLQWQARSPGYWGPCALPTVHLCSDAVSQPFAADLSKGLFG